MSSLQNKMYNQEVQPPANAWEKIAAALDESLLQNEFPSKLYNTTENPPDTAWEKVNEGLDEQFQNGYSSRLYDMEIAPPPATWDKVASALNTPEPVTTPIRIMRPILRYAAAAFFVGLVAYGVTRFTINTGNKENTSVQAISQDDSGTTDKSKTIETEIVQTPDINSQKDDDAALENSRTLMAKLERPGRKTDRSITSSLVTKNSDDEIAEGDLSKSIYAYTDHVPDIADRYVMLMTPDGNIIRMSKKWSDLLCCVSGEEQDPDCKDQLKKWQEKIATSSLAPSPGNFMDILGLVNSLNDNSDL